MFRVIGGVVVYGFALYGVAMLFNNRPWTKAVVKLDANVAA